MKLSQNIFNPVSLIFAMAVCTISLISLNACRSIKNNIESDNPTSDSAYGVVQTKIANDNLQLSSGGKNHYPLIDSINDIVFINDSTKIINNIKVVYSTINKMTTIYLLNGKILTSNEDILLCNDIPKNTFKRNADGISYIDLKVLPYNVKEKLFGQMSTANSIQIKNLKKAGYNNNIFICGQKNNYICKYTNIYVTGHDEEEDNYGGWAVGEIGFTEIYDLNGVKIMDLPRMKNGGDLEIFNDSLNIIIYRREGDDEGNYYGYKWPVMDIYEFPSGKHLFEVRTLGHEQQIFLSENKICAYSGHLNESNATCFYVIDQKERQIFYYKYKYGEPSVINFENDNLVLSDGSKIDINDQTVVIRMDIFDWNSYTKNILK